MRLKPINEINTLDKTAMTFVFMSSASLIYLLVVTSFSDEVELYLVGLRLVAIFSYLSWWINTITIVLYMHKNRWFWIEIFLAIIMGISSLCDIVIALLHRYRFETFYTIKVWQFQNPSVDYAMWLIWLVLVVQYLINTFVIIRRNVIN